MLSVLQKVIPMLDLYAPNNRGSQYRRQETDKTTGKIDKHAVILGEFSTSRNW